MVNLTRELKPISYVKAHTTEVVRLVEETRSPIVITQNGEAKAVLVDIESYEKIQESISLAKLLLLSDMSGKKKGLIPHEKVKERIRKTIKRIRDEKN